MTLSSQLGDLSDEVLALRVAAGDGDAMKVLFERHRKEVFGTACRILRYVEEARDMVQQVYMEAYRDINSFDSSRGTFRAWLLTKALSRSLTRYRQLKADKLWGASQVDTEANLSRNGHRQYPFQLLPSELSQLTGELVSRLEEREQKIVNLLYSVGLTQREVAGEMGITLAAVRYSLTKALTTLRDLLAGHEDGMRK
jgi:RNA polymerase sigma-70 factor (ECF subfamily)